MMPKALTYNFLQRPILQPHAFSSVKGANQVPMHRLRVRIFHSSVTYGEERLSLPSIKTLSCYNSLSTNKSLRSTFITLKRMEIKQYIHAFILIIHAQILEVHRLYIPLSIHDPEQHMETGNFYAV